MRTLMGFVFEEIRPRLAGHAPTPAHGIGRLRMSKNADRRVAASVITGLIFVLGSFTPTSAAADCVPDSATATTGDAVVCSGDTPDGFVAGPGVEDLTIVVETTATMNNAAAGDAAIEINTNNPGAQPVPGIDMQGTLELTGDGSAGVRGAEPNADDEFNSIVVTGLITDTDNDAQLQGGDDVVGIDFGDHAIVVHEGEIILNGDRNVAIKVGDDAEVSTTGITAPTDGFIQISGDDSVAVSAGARSAILIDATRVDYDLDGDNATGIEVGDDGFIQFAGNGPLGNVLKGLQIAGANGRGLVIGDSTGAGPTPSGSGIEITGRIVTLGADARGVVAGDGWDGSSGLIRVGTGGIVRASGADSISIEAGDDARIEVEGTVYGGFNNAVGATGLHTGDQASEEALILVTGLVAAEGLDSVAISTGSKTLVGGTALGDLLLAPSIQIGTRTNSGAVSGQADSSALILFRTDTNPTDYNYLLINPGSSLLANEQNFLQPGRAIAVQGTAGAERVENYGVLRGKVLLEGGDDFFMLGTTGSFAGSQFIDAGDGSDSLELSNRQGVFHNLGEAVFRFSDYWNFEHLLVDDVTPWRATGSAAANEFDSVRITPGSSLSVEGPISFSAGADLFSNAGFFDGEAQLGDGDDTFIQFRTNGLADTVRIDAGPGTDTLDLQDDDATGFGVLDFDNQIMGFEPIFVRSGSSWQLGGDTTAASSGTTLFVEDGAELRITKPLLLDGAVNLSSGSTLRLGVSRNTTGAYLETAGAITIESGSFIPTLAIEPLGSLDAGPVLLLSGASVTGSFGNVVTLPSGQYYEFGDPYTVGPGSLFIDVLIGRRFEPNREATDAHLTAVNAAGPNPALQLFLDELDALPSAEYVPTLDQLHPEAYDAQTSVQLALARRFQQIMLDRPDHCIAPEGSGVRHPRTRIPCRPRPIDVWTTGYGFGRKRTGQVGHVSWKDKGGGGVLGVDHRVGDRLLLSGSLGGAHATSTVESIGSGQFSGLDVGGLVAWNQGPLLVQGFATYGHGWHQADRNIAFSTVARTAHGDYGSNRYGVGGQLAWTFAFSGLDLAPVFDLDWARVSRKAFTETGAAPVNLRVDGASDSVTTVRVGVELSTSLLKKGYWTDFLEKTDGVWEPQLVVRWRQVVQGDSRGLGSTIEGEPTTVGTFSVHGDDANMGFEIGAGLYFTPKGATRVSLDARYDGFMWQDIISHELSGSIRLSF